MTDRTNPNCGRFAQLRRMLAIAAQPFRGSAPGATLVEYLIVTGFVALFAMLAFNRFGRTLHQAYRAEAQHVQGRGVPGAMDLLDLLGGASSGVCDISGVCVPGSGLCFAGETPVMTEAGDRPIRNIVPGERVWAADVQFGAIALKQVKRTMVNHHVPVIALDLEFGAAGRERIKVTRNHNFWVDGDGWLPAEQLDGRALFSTGSAVAASTSGQPVEYTSVYNIEVEGFHTYFVGESHTLVANQTINNPCPPAPGTVPGQPPALPAPGTVGAPLSNDPNPNRLDCGDLHRWRQGDGQPQGPAPTTQGFEKDHVPSNAAIRKRADFLMFRRPLTTAEERAMGPLYTRLKNAIHDQAYTIAIPYDAHKKLSQTQGQRLARAAADSFDLAGAADRNMTAVETGLLTINPKTGQPYASADCIAQYQRAAADVRTMTNDHYDTMIQEIINNTLTTEEQAELLRLYNALP